jgi:hypothetical protein
LRQEDAIIPWLLNIVSDIVIGRSEVETWGIIFYKCSKFTAYPDAVVTMGGGLKDIDKVLSLLV